MNTKVLDEKNSAGIETPENSLVKGKRLSDALAERIRQFVSEHDWVFAEYEIKVEPYGTTGSRVWINRTDENGAKYVTAFSIKLFLDNQKYMRAKLLTVEAHRNKIVLLLADEGAY